MYNAAIRLSDYVTTLSEFSKQEILRYATSVSKQEIIVVNPITNHFRLQSRSQHKKKCILYVGNLKPHKNLVRLVEAYEQVRPEEPLVIVGNKDGLLTIDTELFKKVEKSLFLKHNVFFTGHVSDKKLKEWYAKAKMLVFPSLYEGFGYPPLEAMSYGCPVVAAKTASIPEICEDAVEYIDPLSVESIAAGMKRVLNDPFKQATLSQKGRELIERRQSKKNFMEKVIDACCSYS
jgi:glycosyltransferase involved in cell wall biosynthesis